VKGLARIPREESNVAPDPRAPERTTAQQPTFRDPAGQLHLTQDRVLRQIHPAAVDATLDFLNSPLRASLERSGDLVATEAAKPVAQETSDGGEKRELWLEHPRIDPISYPWEWTTGQWRAAAELTLRIAGQAVDAGWMLKDATPLNILFAGPRPVLVDVLSLERRDPRSAVWLAYGQFVRTFLLPLAAEKLLSWPLRATFFARDGYEPSALYAALRPWQRVRPELLDVVMLATLFEGKSGNAQKGGAAGSHGFDPALAAHILHKRFARLGRQIRRATRQEQRSRWSDYPQSACHYQAADSDEKQRFVQSALELCRPARVLDIGANTGTYSLLAAQAGAQVTALDSDAGALERLWRSAGKEGRTVTTLVANIAAPTPGAGWRNREQLSLLERLTGQFDLVLMLAVIHHLILREQLPLGHIGELCASLTRRWLLLEWVPPADPMYQEWLRGREHLYGAFTEEDLKQAFAAFFEVVDRKALGNGRVLLLLERSGARGPQTGPNPA